MFAGLSVREIRIFLESARAGRRAASRRQQAGPDSREAAAPPAGGRHRTAEPDRTASGGGNDERRATREEDFNTGQRHTKISPYLYICICSVTRSLNIRKCNPLSTLFFIPYLQYTSTGLRKPSKIIFHLKSQAAKYHAIHTNSACCLPLKPLFVIVYVCFSFVCREKRG